MLGMYTAKIFNPEKKYAFLTAKTGTLTGLFLFILGVYFLELQIPSPLIDITVGLSACMILGAFALKKGDSSDIFLIFQKIGDFSFSLYLYHFIILSLLYDYLLQLNLNILSLLFYEVILGTTLSLVISYGLYLFFEKPFLNILKKMPNHFNN